VTITHDAPAGGHEASPPVELSIVMPCLNEAETVATCVAKARQYLERSGVVGEVIVADNGSTDGSQELARAAGARVVDVPQRGYGSALIGGIAEARGVYIVMGDADDSYDFTDLDGFVAKLREGYDLVMGNRFAGGIDKGAMPALHRYLGNPVLSFLGRLFFRTHVRDFHCGLRAFKTDSVRSLGLQCPGMEFASEVVVKATLAGQRIGEVPTRLHPDGRSRPPHLRSWRDGWRHLRFLLMYSPRWLFLIPGIVMCAIGGLLTAVLALTPVQVAGTRFDVGTMVVASALVFLGYQSVLFALFTKTFAIRARFLPRDERIARFERVVSLEKTLVAGGAVALAGMVGVVLAFVRWADTDFGDLNTRNLVRLLVPSVMAVVLGAQTAFAGLFLNILRFEPRRPEADATT